MALNATLSAGNIQGALHRAGKLGLRQRRKKLLKLRWCLHKEWTDEARAAALEARRRHSPTAEAARRIKADRRSGGGKPWQEHVADALREQGITHEEYRAQQEAHRQDFLSSKKPAVVSPHAQHIEAAESWRKWANEKHLPEVAEHYEQARRQFAAGNLAGGRNAMKIGHHRLGRLLPRLIHALMGVR